MTVTSIVHIGGFPVYATGESYTFLIVCSLFRQMTVTSIVRVGGFPVYVARESYTFLTLMLLVANLANTK